MIIHIPDNCKIPPDRFIRFVNQYGYGVVSRGTELHLIESPPNHLDVAIREQTANAIRNDKMLDEHMKQRKSVLSG